MLETRTVEDYLKLAGCSRYATEIVKRGPGGGGAGSVEVGTRDLKIHARYHLKFPCTLFLLYCMLVLATSTCTNYCNLMGTGIPMT